MKRIGVTAAGTALVLGGIGGAAAATDYTASPATRATVTSTKALVQQPAPPDDEQSGEREDGQLGEQGSGDQQVGQVGEQESGQQQNGQVGEQETGEQERGQAGEQAGGG